MDLARLVHGRVTRYIAEAPPSMHANLAAGSAGRIALIGTALACTESEALLAALDDEVQVCRDLLIHEPMDLGLFTGLPGVFWALRNFVSDDAVAGSITEYDALLANHVLRELQPDIIKGTNGIALYAASLDKSPLKLSAQISIARLLRNRLASGSDLGIAHGMAGTIISAITLARSLGPTESQELPELIAGLSLHYADYVRDSKLVVTFCVQDAYRGRMAWCYGPLAAALAIAGAAKYLNDTSLQVLALELTEAALAQNRSEWGIKDFSLCHGIAGVSMMLGEIERLTGAKVDGALAVDDEAMSCFNLIFEGHNADLAADEYTGRDSFLGGACGLGLWALSKAYPSASRKWTLPLIGMM